MWGVARVAAMVEVVNEDRYCCEIYVSRVREGGVYLCQ